MVTRLWTLLLRRRRQGTSGAEWNFLRRAVTSVPITPSACFLTLSDVRFTSCGFQPICRHRLLEQLPSLSPGSQLRPIPLVCSEPFMTANSCASCLAQLHSPYQLRPTSLVNSCSSLHSLCTILPCPEAELGQRYPLPVSQHQVFLKWCPLPKLGPLHFWFVGHCF